MARTAVSMLQHEYGVDPGKIAVIPHGVPALPQRDGATAKRELGLKGCMVLCTSGLLRRSKGIENVIRALPSLVERHPELIYLVLGATHPAVRRTEGEAYRQELQRLAGACGVAQHVHFLNTYLDQSSLLKYLRASDIYITPYHDREQITSGTLAYALGLGLAIISTPYLYAVEVLRDGRGLLADWDSSASIERCIAQYLDQPELRRDCQARALAYGRSMSWAHVGAAYATLFARAAGRALTGAAAVLQG
jgi:glycosyltransferase involved in cell wall biosynthesis